MISRDERLHGGDILRNDWCSDINPYRYTMYLCRGTSRGRSYFKVLTYDGKEQNFPIDDNKMIKVGHIDEYNKFIKALTKLDHSKQKEVEDDN